MISSANTKVARRSGILHCGIPYEGYLEDEKETLKKLGYVTLTAECKDGVRAEEFRSMISACYRLRFLRGQVSLMFSLWKYYAMEFFNLRMEILREYLRDVFLRRRFLALRIVVTRERLLRRAIRRYCRRTIIIVFYRWKYESRWLTFKAFAQNMVIQSLRKNLMAMRLMYFNWRTIVRKKLRLFSAILIQRNFRYHLNHRRTRARLIVTRFLVRKYSYYLWCKRIIEERRRMEFEGRAAHSFCRIAEVRLDRYMYQDIGGMRVTADYLKSCKDRINEESHGFAGTSAKGQFVSRVIPSASQLPRIDEQWTTEGKLLYVVQYKCAMYAADLGRRTYRKEDPPPYWCSCCGEVSLLKTMAEAHTVQCSDSKGRRGEKRHPELITRAGVGLDAGFGVGYSSGASRVIYDLGVQVPRPIRPSAREIRLRPKYDPSKEPLRVKKGLRAKVKHVAKIRSKDTSPKFASNYDVEHGKVSVTGARHADGDDVLPVGAGATAYVEAGAGGGRQLDDFESWRLAGVIVQEIMLTLVHSGPPVSLNK